MTQNSSKDTITKRTEFYLAQAAQCGEDAKSAKLQNVKERALRSQASWRGMAALSSTQEASLAEQAASKANAAETELAVEDLKAAD